MAAAATAVRRARKPRSDRARRPASRRRRLPIEHGVLLTATMCLLAAGAVMVYSASSSRDLLGGGGNGSTYLVRYVTYAAIGLVLMHVLARRGLDAARALGPVLVLASFVLLLAVLVPGIGVEVNGGRRWLGAGPLQFQPSELMKLALLLYGARALATRPSRRVATAGQLARSPLVLVTGLAFLLVVAQPDLGTALVIAFTVAALLVAAGVPLRALASIAGVAALLIVVFALIEPYRRARLTAFLHPWADAGGSGYQSAQGQIALGSGGILGVGLGQSVQKAFYLPEAHTDFILAVIGEEVGVAGVCGVLFLYGMIAVAGLRVARAAVGRYAQLLAAGVTSLIICQALLNVFAVLGLAPLTGVPLPFMSYGSSNLIVLLAAMGLLLNVAANRTAQLRPVESRPRRGGSKKIARANASGDRSGRNSRARRARAGGRRRAAG